MEPRTERKSCTLRLKILTELVKVTTFLFWPEQRNETSYFETETIPIAGVVYIFWVYWLTPFHFCWGMHLLLTSQRQRIKILSTLFRKPFKVCISQNDSLCAKDEFFWKGIFCVMLLKGRMLCNLRDWRIKRPLSISKPYTYLHKHTKQRDNMLDLISFPLLLWAETN